MDIVGFLTEDGVTAIANVVGIVGGISATFTAVYLIAERWRNGHLIKVVLQAKGGDYIKLPSKIPRGEFTRAELQGRLRTLPKMNSKQGHYDLLYTNKPEYINQVYKVANGWQGRTFTIECTNKELRQFNVTIEDE